MKRILHRLSKGSILAYTLILLFIVLVASIGMMSASVTNLKSVSTNDQSANAFQIADSGSQAVVAKIKKAGSGTVGDVDTAHISCDSSVAVLNSGSFLNGSYKVTFLDKDEKALGCDDSLSSVTSIKSVGTYASTARAIEVAVAAGLCSDPDNAGKMVVVAKSNNTHGYDGDLLNNFLENTSGSLVGMKCKTTSGGWINVLSPYGGINVSSSGESLYVIGSYGGNNWTHCVNDGCYVYHGIEEPSDAYGCSGGWAVYGMCPAE